MNHLPKTFLLLVCLIMCAVAGQAATTGQDQYVGVRNGQFYVQGKPYRYVGTNLWYAAILASDGEGGNRQRLGQELDCLQQLGIDNLRILVGADGRLGVPSHVRPVLQTAPGVYNDTLLAGLDRLLVELERRGMKAVLYLNNAWEWSGGYGTYLEWAGMGNAPVPGIDGYNAYQDYVSHFVQNDKAKHMSIEHVKHIVSRVNSITGKPYTESPAIMSWQLCNEPRPFGKANKEQFAQWLQSTARLIKSIDHNHLVSTGSEGKYGCETDMGLFKRLNAMPEVDYVTIHIWPYNWGWIDKSSIISRVDTACVRTRDYIAEHHAIACNLGKPLVLEEFGYPRDGFSFAPASPTQGRDKYYDYVLSLIERTGMAAGCNFWGWGGNARPVHESWQPGDPYTGDPAQEPQGLNSVFDVDAGTLAVIARWAKAMQAPAPAVKTQHCTR